jgi:hypothetical protein
MLKNQKQKKQKKDLSLDFIPKSGANYFKG